MTRQEPRKDAQGGQRSRPLPWKPPRWAKRWLRLGGQRAALLSGILTPEGGLRPYVNVFVGERRLDGLQTALAEGYVVAIIPAVACA
jgi:hypothetical protein